VGRRGIKLVGYGQEPIVNSQPNRNILDRKAPQILSGAPKLGSSKYKPRIDASFFEFASIDQNIDERCRERRQELAGGILFASNKICV
jgi:hypothetical protein